MKTERSDIGDPLRAELVRHERFGGIPRPRSNVGTWHRRVAYVAKWMMYHIVGASSCFFIRGADIQGKKKKTTKVFVRRG